MKNKNISRIVWGLALVITGIVFTLNILGIAEIDIFFDGWWTLFLIIPSFIGLFSKRGRIVNITVFVVGIALLLSAQNILDFASVLQLIVPFVLILIGFKMIFSPSFKHKPNEKIRELKNNGKSYLNDSAAFSAHKIDFDGQIFEGAILDAVFGSITCDLSNAIIENDCFITASAVFAGIDIKIPEHIQVNIDSNVLFGGVNDKRKDADYQNNHSDKSRTIYIEANCLFGGLNVI
ncbi:MAG: cell wall-active antibiotics response protein [Ruminococcaceae bacterium]|nr:cell wall-active antibiotics response protein [Oscillospiraceae bacterium]